MVTIITIFIVFSLSSSLLSSPGRLRYCSFHLYDYIISLVFFVITFAVTKGLPPCYPPQSRGIASHAHRVPTNLRHTAPSDASSNPSLGPEIESSFCTRAMPMAWELGDLNPRGLAHTIIPTLHWVPSARPRHSTRWQAIKQKAFRHHPKEPMFPVLGSFAFVRLGRQQQELCSQTPGTLDAGIIGVNWILGLSVPGLGFGQVDLVTFSWEIGVPSLSWTAWARLPHSTCAALRRGLI